MRRAALSVALFVQAALAASAAHAQLLNRAPAAAPPEPGFRVGNIKVEGLQRISEGTVYNYLPVNIGDQLTPQRVREAIRALKRYLIRAIWRLWQECLEVQQPSDQRQAA